MNRALNWTGQALLYGSFALVVGVFSRWPSYHPLSPNEAQIKVSFIHHGARIAECRPYTAEELAKLTQNPVGNLVSVPCSTHFKRIQP